MEPTFVHDAAVAAFDTADAITTDSGESFKWDEQNVVTVDAPADLEGAFDTNKFYKISDVTVARPIKQPYIENDDVKIYTKPAEELRKAAWSFDNVPFTIRHPETGMVKDVNDIHGFWRNAHYDDDAEKLLEDLYVPVADDEAQAFLDEHQGVSVGFYNRTLSSYDGDVGGLVDSSEVDGFQTDMYGNHIAAVEQGRCSEKHGCKIDGFEHGRVVESVDATTSYQTKESMTMEENMFSEGDRVRWVADAIVAHNPSDEDGVMIEIMDRDGDSTEMVTTVDEDSIWPVRESMDSVNNCPCDAVVDAPSGLYEEDGDWYGISPSETADDEPKYELNNCNDVKDAWNLRGSGDYDVEQSTLEARIKRAAESHDCPTENKPWVDNTTDTMTEFDIPDLSADRIVEENDAVAEIKEERDELREAVDEMESEIETHLDSLDNISVSYDDDECVCDAVEALVEAADEAAGEAEEVEDLRDQLEEYQAEEHEEALDTLVEYGAERDEWEDESLDALESEIERREEVIDAVGDGTSVKAGTDSSPSNTNNGGSKAGKTYPRGHNA